MLPTLRGGDGFVEYLGEVAERVAQQRPSVRGLLEALGAAAAADKVGHIMREMERAAPGLAAAFGCYVGMCRPPLVQQPTP